MEVLFVASLSVMFPMVAVLILDWRWPKAPPARLVILAAMMLPLVIVALAIWGVASIGDTSGSPDAGGYALLAIIWFGTIALAISLIVGIPTSHFTLRYLRKRP